jgi:hypothetical protein
LTVTCALVLKCLGTQSVNDELLTESFYDAVLVVSFIVAIPVGFVLTVCATRTMIRESLQERTRSAAGDDDSSTRAKQRAIKLLHLGLTTNDDMRLLAVYFGQLENSAYQ